jgi:hypothetical protein
VRDGHAVLVKSVTLSSDLIGDFMSAAEERRDIAGNPAIST